MGKTIIVGIAGKAGSGKDTLSSLLGHIAADTHDFERIGFADAVKEECAYYVSEMIGVSRSKALDLLYDRNEKEKWRWFLQGYATEFRREMHGDNYWVKQVEMQINRLKAEYIGKGRGILIVIPDLRFPNESEWIKSVGGYRVQVVRNAVERTDSHSSEIPLSPDLIDITALNDSNIEGFKKQAERVWKKVSE